MSKLRFTLMTLLFLAPAAWAVDISGGSPEDQQQMQVLSKLWIDAYSTGDLESLMGIMHPDAMVMAHNQSSVRGLDAVRDYFSTRIGRPGVTFIDDLQEIRINGNWAFVRGEFYLSVMNLQSEKVYEHNGRYLVLYEKVDGEWKMLRDMDNAVPPRSLPGS